MSKSKLILAIVVIVFVLLQIVPSGRPETTMENNNDLFVNNQIPDSVSTLMRKACFDCHSNESKYPWYAYVAPVSWLVNRDIRKGRKHLNLSEWESLSKMDKASVLDDLSEAVSEGEMPMPIYVLMHPEAKLTKADRELLVNWAEDFAEQLFE